MRQLEARACASGVVTASQTGAEAVLERRGRRSARPGAASSSDEVAERDDAQPEPRARASASCLRRPAREQRRCASSTTQRDRPAARPRPRPRRSTLSLSIWPKMYTDATSVLNGMLPEISTTEPNSPIARAKASADAGEDRRQQVRQDDAAEDREAARRRATRRPPPSRGRARAAPAAPRGPRTAASRTAAPARPPPACRRR